LSPGDELCDGRYVVEELLGRGGFGIVYLVGDRELGGRRFALKTLPAELARSPRDLEDLKREVNYASEMRHEGIVAVYDLVRAKPTSLIKMEYVNGPTFAEVLRDKKRVAVERAIDWVRQASEALAYAHGKGVIHQDLKPANPSCAKSRPNSA
jgi:serine/threonine-protein kinase